jgi:succinyl-CoA synthetase beta subunit
MNFEEHVAKPLLAEAGIAVPRGSVAATPEEAAEVAAGLGAVMVKAQVPAGRRGKAGGVRAADTPEAAAAAARDVLGMEIGGHRVERVLVEEQVAIAREFYAAVLSDPASKGPLVMFSTEGGMEIEEVAASNPEAIRRQPVDILGEFDEMEAQVMLAGLDLGDVPEAMDALIARLYRLYLRKDAELVEINPLALTDDGRLVALDCKFVLDDAAAPRQPELAALAAPEPITALEARGRDLGLRFIELDGDIGVLANGAGNAMTTMDVIRHYGGRPANFLEIGGAAYIQARPALELVLANPRVRSLVVSFYGALARTEVMTEGVIDAWQALQPGLPIAFSIHGTGEEAAIPLLRERLGLESHDLLDDAVKAAVAAARAGR